MSAWRLPFNISLPEFHRRSTEAEQVVETPPAQLQEFLVKLGAALLGTGTASTDIQQTLKRVATALGSPTATIVVLPTIMFIGIPGAEDARFEIAETAGGEVLFDRAAMVYAIVDDAIDGKITVDEGISAVDATMSAKPRFNRVVRIFGHGIAAAGVGMVLLGASPTSLVWAFVFGTLVGLAKVLIRPGTYASILLPVTAAFVISVIVFLGSQYGLVAEPLQVLIPPLVTLLPGGLLTTGIQELAAGDMIAGSSRLVYGLAQLVFLSFGIIAAIAITRVPASSALSLTQGSLDYQPWVGVVLLAIGFFFYYCGPRRSLYYLIGVLLVAYGAQLLGSLLLGTPFSGFVGALALTLAAYLVQSLPGAPPAVVCFLPAFWLLVPGATGLISLTKTAAGASISGGSLGAFAGAIVAIALGVLTGTALYRQIFRVAPARWGLRLV